MYFYLFIYLNSYHTNSQLIDKKKKKKKKLTVLKHYKCRGFAVARLYLFIYLFFIVVVEHYRPTLTFICL